VRTAREGAMAGVSRCSACGAFVDEEDQFCWSCGSALGKAPDRPAAPAPQPVAEGDPEAAFTVRAARLAQQRGQPEEAERLLREALERAPENASALSLLAEILRGKGDLVGAVALAQQATEAAGADAIAPGAVARAREARAEIEEGVVRQVTGRAQGGDGGPVSALLSAGDTWYRSGRFYTALAGLGVITLFLALVVSLRGESLGYLWFAVSFFAAGWCYQDAETRRTGGLMWGPFVLLLGPFGLAIYLLARY